MAKKKNKKREKLIGVVKRELRARGYKEVEPDPDGGGQWFPPDDDWSDNIIAAITDCFDREAKR
jgi:hypothetical protein